MPVRFKEDEIDPAEESQNPQTGPEPAAQVSAKSSVRFQPEEPEKMGALEAGGRHFLDSALFGHGAELGGAISALGRTPGIPYKESMGDTYRSERDRLQALLDRARKDQPVSSIAGQVGGAITGAIPVAGALGTAGRTASFGQKLGSAAKLGAVEGAMYGSGESPADLTKLELGKYAEDVGTGIGTGAATGGLLSLIGQGATKAGQAVAGSKYGKAFQGGAEVQKFANPEEKQALANDITENLKGVLGENTKEHMAARQAFNEKYGGLGVDTSGIIKKEQDFTNRYGPRIAMNSNSSAFTPGEMSELKRLEANIDKSANAQDLYKIWDSIKAKKLKYDVIYPDDSSEYQKSLKILASGIKDKLHEMSPELTAADQKLSGMLDMAQSLKRAQNSNQTENFLSQITGKRQNLNTRDNLQEILKEKPDLLKDIDNLRTFNQFEGQGGFGSIHGVRHAIGIGAGAALGGPAGAIAGSVLSSPKTARYIATNAGDMYRNSPIPQMMQGLGQIPVSAPQSAVRAPLESQIIQSKVNQPEPKAPAQEESPVLGVVNWINQQDPSKYGDLIKPLFDKAKAGDPQAQLVIHLLKRTNPKALQSIEGAK